MQELKSNRKFRPPNKVKDAASLNSLLGFLNNPAVTGAVLPKGEIVNAIPVEAAQPPGATAIKETPAIERPTPAQLPVSSPAVAPASLNKIAFTGRFLSGKDFAAEAAGLKVFSLAQPLYGLQEYFFGTSDKTVPGAREFLQTVGQWGRGEISKQYPLTPERALFCQSIRDNRSEFAADLGVAWQLFGSDPDLWLNALLARVNTYLGKNPGARVAVTNARFENELKRLTAEGYVHFHCLCSAPTWSARLQKVNLAPDSPATRDISEQLAASLDQNVIHSLSKAKQGPKLKCIWSDEKMQPPSSRLLTVKEFSALFPKV